MTWINALFEWADANLPHFVILSACVSLLAILCSYRFIKRDQRSYRDSAASIKMIAESISEAIARSNTTDQKAELLELQSEKIQKLEEIVRRLKVEETGDKNVTFEAHKSGDKSGAVHRLKKISDDLEASGSNAFLQASEAYTKLGDLVFLNDTMAALQAYQKAVSFDESNLHARTRLGQLEMRVGNFEAASETFNMILARSDHERDASIEAIVLGNLGNIAELRGNLNEAEDIYIRALAIERELERKQGIAAAIGNLGIIAHKRGDLDRAEAYHNQSLAIHQDLGRKEGMASDLGNLGLIAQSRGDLNQAEDYLNQSLAIDKDLGRKEGMAIQLGNLGLVAEERGDMAEACRLWTEARDLYSEIGMPHMVERVQSWLDEAQRAPDDKLDTSDETSQPPQ